MLTTLVTVVIVLVILGVALYLIETYLPMARPFKIVIRAVVVIGLLLWLLQLAGLWSYR
jgi:hypothetical protein